MTKTRTYRSIFLFLIVVCVAALAWSDSGRQYRRSAIMNGNQVRTVFGNWGVIGQPAESGHRGAWRYDNDGYIGDVTPLVGVEVKTNGTVFHSVGTCPASRPALRQDVDPVSGKPWTFEPVGGYFNPNQQKVALSTDRVSWPSSWPDKLNDPNDPGWSGSWNGYFGKRISADQETYFVMDDNNDERFNSSSNNALGVAFKPDSTNSGRNGMALVMSIRAMQWAQFLAKDNIFWLYEITNTGTTTYDRAVFGMLVGTYVGVTSTEDYQEYNDDWSFYDVNNNICFTGDFKAINGQRMKNPLWIGGTGLVGYAFLESPGNPFDGIDNDGDSDSSSTGRSAPKFVQADFDSVLLTAGKRIVLINDDYSRQVYAIPPVDSVQVYTRGYLRWIFPGKTKVAEGNLLQDFQGNQFINPNAYDGIDNNYNGLIDENYFVHYHQIKQTRTTPPVKLIDVLRPLRHIDFLTNTGTSPFSMIDEKRNDLVDNNGNWDVRYDDLGRDGIADTHDFGEADGQPTSGYDVNGHDTGLPGEPHIDKTDVQESDQIGLTSFFYFAPSGNVNLEDKEGLWKNLAPGFFDVPPSIVNNRPQGGEDGDFFYGSGFFPLLAKLTERFSLALVYGGGNGGGLDADLADLLKNKKTVQKIYDANYQFPQPPDKPTLVAVPDDRKVTLYWDRKSEASIDPVLRTKTFEGYKIYKSTDPNFSDIFTITDGSGSPQGYKPLTQFDIKDGVIGYFQAQSDLYQGASGFTFFLGSDTGLVHSYVDRDVENGRKYYYALVAYSKGDATVGIFPAENTKFVTIQPTGEVLHDINVAVVTPNAKTAGYVTPTSGVPLSHTAGVSSGSAAYQVLDPNSITGHRYRVEFLDTQVDSIDAAGVPHYSPDSTKWARVTTSYSVRDLQDIVESIVSLDTSVVVLTHKNIIRSTAVVRNHAGAIVAPTDYILNAELGNIRGARAGSLPAGSYTLTYQYYPVWRSPNLQGTPFLADSKDTDVFDGVQLVFNNIWGVTKNDSASGWIGKNAYVYNFSPVDLPLVTPPLKGYRKPSDYEIRFSNAIVDTSLSADFYPPTPVNFRIFNTTDSTYAKFYFSSPIGAGYLSPLAEIILVEQDPRGSYSPTWDFFFVPKVGDPPDTVYNLTTGDKLVVKTRKPFEYGDAFEFLTVKPSIDDAKAKGDLLRVRVVPNPYVTASEFEPPLNPGITSGRGQRKIDFIHLPAHATIKIFTSRGDHVVTLSHDGNIEDGTLSWDLKTYENLDVAYGVYFYVVESPVGNKTGKIAIIK